MKSKSRQHQKGECIKPVTPAPTAPEEGRPRLATVLIKGSDGKTIAVTGPALSPSELKSMLLGEVPPATSTASADKRGAALAKALAKAPAELDEDDDEVEEDGDDDEADDELDDGETDADEDDE